MDDEAKRREREEEQDYWLGKSAEHEAEDEKRRYIGVDKPVVEFHQQASRFDDSDNMPDDPEQNWEEKDKQ